MRCIFYLVLALAVIGCVSSSKPADVVAVGDRTQIMRGELAGRVALADLRDRSGLFGLGPVAGLRGEITILDGVPHVCVLDKQGQPVELTPDDAWQQSAIFLAYGYAERANPLATLDSVDDLASLRPAVERVATEAGIDLETVPFGVVIEGVAEQITYHVIWKDDDAPHSMAEHQKAKIKFDRRGVPVRLLAIYSRPGEGKVTHPGNPLHVHAVLPAGGGSDGNDEAATVSGHVDALQLRAGATLSLLQAN